MYMYEFSDAIDKVNFDEEFSDVADNIKMIVGSWKV